jgi:hypothetical protein
MIRAGPRETRENTAGRVKSPPELVQAKMVAAAPTRLTLLVELMRERVSLRSHGLSS